MRNLMKINSYLTIIMLLVIPSFALDQQTKTSLADQPSPQISVQQVKGTIYLATGGSGANSGFFVGEKEVVVIDAKMDRESAEKMTAEIRRLTSNPIAFIILTHSDGGHVNGLTGFPKGINIIAHRQTRKDMEEAFKEPRLITYLPNLSFSNEANLYSGNKLIRLLHFGPAHTSGDAVVFFPDEKVAFLGDLLFINRDSLIHRNKGGTSFGLVKNLKAVLELDADTFIPGHGEKANRVDVEGLAKSIEEKQAAIKKLIDEGKTFEEIKKIYNVEDRPAQPGRMRWLSLAEVIYLDLTDKKT